MLINHAEKWIFLHVPKAAGMYIERSLGYEHKTSYHFVTENLSKYPDYFRFMFVRNPATRFVSNYRYCIKMSKEPPPVGNRFDRKLVREKNLDVNQFAELFFQNTDAFFKTIHYVPQYVFAQRFKPHFIGSFENLHEDMAILMRLLGRDYEPSESINATSTIGRDDQIDTAMRQKVVQIYKLDMLRFGYLDELNGQSSC